MKKGDEKLIKVEIKRFSDKLNKKLREIKKPEWAPQFKYKVLNNFIKKLDKMDLPNEIKNSDIRCTKLKYEDYYKLKHKDYGYYDNRLKKDYDNYIR